MFGGISKIRIYFSFIIGILNKVSLDSNILETESFRIFYFTVYQNLVWNHSLFYWLISLWTGEE